MGAADIRWRKLGGHTDSSAAKSPFLDLAVKRYRELNPNVVPLVNPFSTGPLSAKEKRIVDEILSMRTKMNVEVLVQTAIWKLVSRSFSFSVVSFRFGLTTSASQSLKRIVFGLVSFLFGITGTHEELLS